MTKWRMCVIDINQKASHWNKLVKSMQKKILDLISSEPSYRLVLYKILRFCEIPRLASEVEEEVLFFPEMKTAIHSPRILLGWLGEAGGIERVVVEEKERWQTTDAGKKVAEMGAPEKRLLELIAKEPVYSEVYMQVLKFCHTPRTRAEIEELLEGNPVMVMEEPKVYSKFFIQRLEEAAGLEWVDKKWRTTEAAKRGLG